MRGDKIKGNMVHDAGAYAQCGACGRYTDLMGIITGDFPCECGKSGYWSCSFKKPTDKSIWHK